MQNLIRTAFTSCTIIAVVHRLHTIIDFDKVFVMNEGRIAEFGSPDELLSRQNGLFRQLYRRNNPSKEIDIEHYA